MACRVFVSLDQGASCAKVPGLVDPPPDRPRRPGIVECEVRQIAKPAGETCSRDVVPGFCYVENTEASLVVDACSQALVFSAAIALPPSGFVAECP